MNPYTVRLADLTSGVLYGNDGTPKENVSRLYYFFRELGGVGFLAGSSETTLDSGIAISPYKAINCLLDTTRSVMFIRGLYCAIREAQRRFPGERIEVLYAGSGPFAPLALPLTTHLSPLEAIFTVIDIHQASVDNVATLVDKLGKSAYFQDIKRDDATTYVCNPTKKPHVVVTETMDAGLLNEPQAAITLNIAPQLRDSGIFVPDCVEVNAYMRAEGGGSQQAFPLLKRSLRELKYEGHRVELGTIVNLTKDTVPKKNKSRVRLENGKLLVRRVFRLPQLTGNYEINLGTKVHVFGEHKLEEDESDITLARHVNTCRMTPDITKLGIMYTLGSQKISSWFG